MLYIIKQRKIVPPHHHLELLIKKINTKKNCEMEEGMEEEFRPGRVLALPL
jgi:hypothetical protein